MDARIGDSPPGDPPRTDHERRLLRLSTDRFSVAGLALVLLLLASFGIWAAVTTDHATKRLELSSRLNSAFEHARFAASTEESLERSYRLEPTPDVRALFDQASASLQTALTAVQSEGVPDDSAVAGRILSLHAKFVEGIGRMFDAVDTQDPALVLAIDHSMDPVFSNIEHLLEVEASEHQGQTTQLLSSLGNSSTLIFFATPITFVVGLMLLGFFFWLLMGYRRRTEEVTKRELTTEVRQQQRLRHETVRSAEEERARIAGELHDGPIQHLTALDYRLEAASRRAANGKTEPTGDPLRQAQVWLRQDISELRNMMAELRMPVIDQRGLAIAIGSYADALTRDSTLECRIDSRVEGNLDPTSEVVLYRVAQEALRNVVKHAHAHHAEVVLDRRNGSTVLEVRDDGEGFDPPTPDQQTDLGHYGLEGMRERVELAGGALEVESARGTGTRIIATLPREGAAP